MNIFKIIIFLLINFSAQNVIAEINNIYVYSSIDNLMLSVKDFFTDCNEYPSVEKGLQELVNSNKKCWKGPYIKPTKIINQRCENQYKYSRIDSSSFVIIDSGKDCIYGTNDDLTTNDSPAIKQVRISQFKQDVDFYIFLRKIIILLLILMILYVSKIVYRKIKLRRVRKRK